MTDIQKYQAMTNEELNIRVAKRLGKVKERDLACGVEYDIPNYARSLDDCREFEDWLLSRSQVFLRYKRIICDARDKIVGQHNLPSTIIRYLLELKPRDKCIVFLAATEGE